MNALAGDKVEYDAKELMVDFLRVYSKKFFIKVKFKVFFERCKLFNIYHTFIVYKIQSRIKNYLNGMKGRIELLSKMWNKEHTSMVM